MPQVSILNVLTAAIFISASTAVRASTSVEASQRAMNALASENTIGCAA